MSRPLPREESIKLNAPPQLQIIDTAPDEALDDLACLAAYTCETPTALIFLVKGNYIWLKAKTGLKTTDIAGVLELCSLILPTNEVVVVPDTKVDQRLTNAAVVHLYPNIRFYAGVPLITPKMRILGTLCVIDHIPRELNWEQIEVLQALSRQVIRQLEQQRNLTAMANAVKEGKQTEQKLQESQIRLKLLNSISTRITAGMSVEQVIEHTIKQISEHFKSLRIVYSTIDEQNINVLYSLQPPGMAPLDQIVPVQDLPEFVNSLRNYRPVVTNDVTKAPWLEPCTEVFLSFGIAATVSVPLHHSDKLVGLICCDSPEPRQWTEHEIATLKEIAEYLSFALKEAHAQQQRSQAEAALRQQHQQERLLGKITQQIRRSLNLEEILQTTVTEIRDFFQAERVVVYCYQQGRNGMAIAQSAHFSWTSSVNMRMDRSWFEKGTKFSQKGSTYVIDDIEQVELPLEFHQFLAQQQVQAALLVPILENYQLLGMVAVYECSQSRHWQIWEMDLLKQLAIQVAIAIQQGKLYQQVEQLNSNLEQKVEQRTAQLKQALDLEAILKRISDQVRDSLDETEILQTAVEQLALPLEVDCCCALVYPLEQGSSTDCYEQITSVTTSPSKVEPIAEFPEIYQQLLQQQYLECCFLSWEEPQARMAILVCPIVDEQEVLGELRLETLPHHSFNDVEIRLVRQVANQCAIAVRQARLYKAAQQQAEALESLNHLKDDFLSSVSHELRSPMTNIKIALKMLEISFKQVKLVDTEGKIQRYLQILQDESKRELDLINDLLDLSRLEAGSEPLQLSTIKLQECLPEIIQPFAARAHSQQQLLEVELPTQLPPLNSDQNALERIFSELLNNACKYTPPGEKITVSAWSTQTKIQLRVSNSGVEIPQEELSLIFQKFYRIPHHDSLKKGGTGLGLALVKKLVEHLGGTIEVESATAKTMFTVQLPLTPNFSNKAVSIKKFHHHI
ncbi:MAG: GAF domain-containing sensor histidine kinase [Symploca sp. SIO1B1]|nr:GAF domain-containing sensor histidine kinase [Symploca sp. SIO1B1]